MTLGRQAEMFDEAGQVTLAVKPAPAAKPAASRAIVSVQSRSRTTARVVATTRVQAATRVMAAPQAAARGEVARHLFMSKSLSSGQEGSRWFSVPQRVLLPRYQLFEGADAVIEERPGQWRLGSPRLRQQRGQVWFV